MESRPQQPQERPRITFPCDYPVKVLGEQTDDFAELVVAIVRRHDPGLGDDRISFRESGSGRYLSVQVLITATGTEQLEALFADLKASGRVAVVL